MAVGPWPNAFLSLASDTVLALASMRKSCCIIWLQQVAE